MIEERWLGATSNSVQIHVTKEMIATYAKAIHLDSTIYTNFHAAKTAGYQDIPAPPTLPMIFWQYITVPWLQDADLVVHGKQRFFYEQLLLANRTYDCSIHLKDLKKKQSKRGLMQISIHELVITYHDCIHATAHTTLIIYEK